MSISDQLDADQFLVCPVSKLSLTRMSLRDAEARLGGVLKARQPLKNAKSEVSEPAGVTEIVLVREDNECAYPVVDNVPVLLAPECLTLDGETKTFDLTESRYAEAYEEMAFYNTRANETAGRLGESSAWSILPTEMAATEAERVSFPAPWERWIDAVHDSAAQWDAYAYLGKMPENSFLQLGGSGTHAIKFAMAGASNAWLVTPMTGEALVATALAESAGVGQQFRAVVAIAEELPFRSEAFDGIFTGGCLHHTVTDLALPEAARVLRQGGKFAAAEPWRAPLYSIGTKLLGKREDAYCRPLTAERLRSLDAAFSSHDVVHHGAMTRYPLIALEKFGLPVPKSVPWRLGKIDDSVASVIPGIRGMGSSIAILAEK